MDFSKYKVMFNNLLKRTQRTNRIYLNLYGSNDKNSPLISSTNQATPITSTISTGMIEPVLREISESSEALEIIQLSDLEIQQEALKLKDLLDSNISEATIHNLLQYHNTAESAINAYLDNQIIEQI